MGSIQIHWRVRLGRKENFRIGGVEGEYGL